MVELVIVDTSGGKNYRTIFAGILTRSSSLSERS